MTRTLKSGLGSAGSSARSATIALLACCITQVWAVDQRRMNDVVERQNRNLPTMVANQLRQEKMEVSGLSIVYRYTHLGLNAAQLREMRLDVTQRPYIFPRMCQEADAGRMRREGVSFRYVYIGKGGGVGGQLQISPADCR